jgi:tetratricopeptide (TPR) repeat protein
VTYYYKGDFDHAIEDYNQTLEINPKFVRAYNDLGLIYLENKHNIEKACHYYELACQNGWCKRFDKEKQNGNC